MLDSWVQCVFSVGANSVHRLVSSSWALCSSAVQVPGVAPITSAAPRQLDAMSKLGTPPAARCEVEGRAGVTVLVVPVVSAEIFAQAAMSGLLCVPRVRHDACCSVGKIAGVRRAPQ